MNSAWLGGRYRHAAIEGSASTAFELPLTAIDDLCERDPRAARMLLAAVAGHATDDVQSVRAQLATNVTARFARWLLDAGADGSAPQVVIAKSKRWLPSELGTSPETLSRTLRKLSDAGVVQTTHRTVRLVDALALRRLVGARSVRSLARLHH